MNSDLKDIITNLEEYSDRDLKTLSMAIHLELAKRFMEKFPKKTRRKK